MVRWLVRKGLIRSRWWNAEVKESGASSRMYLWGNPEVQRSHLTWMQTCVSLTSLMPPRLHLGPLISALHFKYFSSIPLLQNRAQHDFSLLAFLCSALKFKSPTLHKCHVPVLCFFIHLFLYLFHSKSNPTFKLKAWLTYHLPPPNGTSRLLAILWIAYNFQVSLINILSSEVPAKGKNMRWVTEFRSCHLLAVGFHQVIGIIKFLKTSCSLPFYLYRSCRHD